MNDLPLAERGRLLSELAATLATLPTDRAQTWRLGEATRLVLRADGVAIALEYLSDNRVTLCASDEVAAALEGLQEVLGQGPAFEAARNDEVAWRTWTEMPTSGGRCWRRPSSRSTARSGCTPSRCTPTAGSAGSRRSTRAASSRWPSRTIAWCSWSTRSAPPW